MHSRLIVPVVAALAAASAQAAPLHVNGPVVDAQGLSILAPPYATIGVGVQASFGNVVADDFVVGGAGWQVTDLQFFAYKNTFDFTAVTWSIVAGHPLTGAVVAGGSTAVTNGGLVGYRVLSTAPGDTSRRIFDIRADVPDLVLAPGTYWLTWSLQAATVGPFGPWQPPVAGDPSGNALQSGSFPWTAVIDPGSQGGLALPFQVNGIALAIPEPATGLMWAMGMLALAARSGLGRRRG